MVEVADGYADLLNQASLAIASASVEHVRGVREASRKDAVPRKVKQIPKIVRSVVYIQAFLRRRAFLHRFGQVGLDVDDGLAELAPPKPDVAIALYMCRRMRCPQWVDVQREAVLVSGVISAKIGGVTMAEVSEVYTFYTGTLPQNHMALISLNEKLLSLIVEAQEAVQAVVVKCETPLQVQHVVQEFWQKFQVPTELQERVFVSASIRMAEVTKKAEKYLRDLLAQKSTVPEFRAVAAEVDTMFGPVPTGVPTALHEEVEAARMRRVHFLETELRTKWTRPFVGPLLPHTKAARKYETELGPDNPEVQAFLDDERHHAAVLQATFQVRMDELQATLADIARKRRDARAKSVAEELDSRLGEISLAVQEEVERGLVQLGPDDAVVEKRARDLLSREAFFAVYVLKAEQTAEELRRQIQMVHEDPEAHGQAGHAEAVDRARSSANTLGHLLKVLADSGHPVYAKLTSEFAKELAEAADVEVIRPERVKQQVAPEDRDLDDAMPSAMEPEVQLTREAPPSMYRMDMGIQDLWTMPIGFEAVEGLQADEHEYRAARHGEVDDPTGKLVPDNREVDDPMSRLLASFQMPEAEQQREESKESVAPLGQLPEASPMFTAGLQKATSSSAVPGKGPGGMAATASTAAPGSTAQGMTLLRSTATESAGDWTASSWHRGSQQPAQLDGQVFRTTHFDHQSSSLSARPFAGGYERQQMYKPYNGDLTSSTNDRALPVSPKPLIKKKFEMHAAFCLTRHPAKGTEGLRALSKAQGVLDSADTWLQSTQARIEEGGILAKEHQAKQQEAQDEKEKLAEQKARAAEAGEDAPSPSEAQRRRSSDGAEDELGEDSNKPAESTSPRTGSSKARRRRRRSKESKEDKEADEAGDESATHGSPPTTPVEGASRSERRSKADTDDAGHSPQGSPHSSPRAQSSKTKKRKKKNKEPKEGQEADEAAGEEAHASPSSPPATPGEDATRAEAQPTGEDTTTSESHSKVTSEESGGKRHSEEGDGTGSKRDSTKEKKAKKHKKKDKEKDKDKDKEGHRRSSGEARSEHDGPEAAAGHSPSDSAAVDSTSESESSPRRKKSGTSKERNRTRGEKHLQIVEEHGEEIASPTTTAATKEPHKHHRRGHGSRRSDAHRRSSARAGETAAGDSETSPSPPPGPRKAVLSGKSAFDTNAQWAGMYGGIPGTGFRHHLDGNDHLPRLVGKPSVDELKTPAYVRSQYRIGTIGPGPPYKISQDEKNPESHPVWTAMSVLDRSLDRNDWQRTYNQLHKPNSYLKVGPTQSIRDVGRVGSMSRLSFGVRKPGVRRMLRPMSEQALRPYVPPAPIMKPGAKQKIQKGTVEEVPAIEDREPVVQVVKPEEEQEDLPPQDSQEQSFSDQGSTRSSIIGNRKPRKRMSLKMKDETEEERRREEEWLEKVEQQKKEKAEQEKAAQEEEEKKRLAKKAERERRKKEQAESTKASEATIDEEQEEQQEEQQQEEEQEKEPHASADAEEAAVEEPKAPEDADVEVAPAVEASDTAEEAPAVVTPPVATDEAVVVTPAEADSVPLAIATADAEAADGGQQEPEQPQQEQQAMPVTPQPVTLRFSKPSVATPKAEPAPAAQEPQEEASAEAPPAGEALEPVTEEQQERDPSKEPSPLPSKQEPSRDPSKQSEHLEPDSVAATPQPSKEPSRDPSKQAEEPSAQPSPQASKQEPSRDPSKEEHLDPESQDQSEPSREPSKQPDPSKEPSREPSKQQEDPSKEPTPQPSKEPTPQPSKQPTPQPSKEPSREPSKQQEDPSKEPTPQPSKQPTPQPSKEPSREPSKQPDASKDPTPAPSKEPSLREPSKERDPSKASVAASAAAAEDEPTAAAAAADEPAAESADDAVRRIAALAKMVVAETMQRVPVASAVPEETPADVASSVAENDPPIISPDERPGAVEDLPQAGQASTQLPGPQQQNGYPVRPPVQADVGQTIQPVPVNATQHRPVAGPDGRHPVTTNKGATRAEVLNFAQSLTTNIFKASNRAAIARRTASSTSPEKVVQAQPGAGSRTSAAAPAPHMDRTMFPAQALAPTTAAASHSPPPVRSWPASQPGVTTKPQSPPIVESAAAAPVQAAPATTASQSPPPKRSWPASQGGATVKARSPPRREAVTAMPVEEGAAASTACHSLSPTRSWPALHGATVQPPRPTRRGLVTAMPAEEEESGLY